MKKINIFLSVWGLFVFFFYLPVLNLFFTSDDFFYTNFSLIRDVIFPHPGLYHYSPVFWSIMLLIKSISGINPFIFHLAALFMHIANVILLYFLAVKLLGKKTPAMVSLVIFSFFFSHYETVYWVTGIDTSLMVFLYQLNLLIFLRYLKSNSLTDYLLYLLTFFAAILSHEYAVSLPIVAGLYLLLIHKRLNIKKTVTILFPPSIFIFFLFLFKIFYSSATLTVTSPSIITIIRSIIKSSIYLFIPIPQIIDYLPKFLLPVLFLILAALLFYQSRMQKIRMFLLLWTLTTVIIFSVTSLPQARYFYLSSIPAMMLFSSILIPNKLKSDSFIFLKFIYLFLIIISGMFFLKQQMGYWQKSSRIILDSREVVKKSISGKEKIYILDLPDSINGPPWNAYLYRSNPDLALNIDKDKMILLRTVHKDAKVRNDPYIEKDQIDELIKRGELIFRFNPGAQQLMIY